MTRGELLPARVACAGHRAYSQDVATWLRRELRILLGTQARRPLTGVTCLAEGADQLFAHTVLEVGGTLDVVVPAVDFRDHLPAEAKLEYDRLLARASSRYDLGEPAATPEAYAKGNLAMLDRAEALVAVWDGAPARGAGGTAEVVAAAQAQGKPVRVLWPEGARR